jgi:hypothetical protein
MLTRQAAIRFFYLVSFGVFFDALEFGNNPFSPFKKVILNNAACTEKRQQ